MLALIQSQGTRPDTLRVATSASGLPGRRGVGFWVLISDLGPVRTIRTCLEPGFDQVCVQL